MALPSVNQIPDKLIGATVYNEDGKMLYGMADVELPSQELMSEAVSGLGIMGEINTPADSQYKAMTVKWKWNTLTPDAFELMEPGSHRLEFYAAAQLQDASAHKAVKKQIKVVVSGQMLKLSFGKLEKAKTMDADAEMSVDYIKVSYDGKTYTEYDPLSWVDIQNGKDGASELRQILGME